jgi:hypothetical protein
LRISCWTDARKDVGGDRHGVASGCRFRAGL